MNEIFSNEVMRSTRNGSDSASLKSLMDNWQRNKNKEATLINNNSLAKAVQTSFAKAKAKGKSFVEKIGNIKLPVDTVLSDPKTGKELYRETMTVKDLFKKK